jgi:hypothetical protein
VTYAGARTAGFWFALQVPQLDRILLTARSRRGLLVGATLIATLVVCS